MVLRKFYSSRKGEALKKFLICVLILAAATVAARVAFAEGKDTISLTHLLPDRKDLNARLMDTYWARHDRVFSGSQNTSARIMENLPPFVK